MLSLNDVVVISDKIVTRETEGELVVVLPEKGKFVVLNATGAEMMQLADGERTLAEIATEIADRFDADLSRVQTDVLNFARDLTSRDVLIVRS
jgi:coenzyme PQQ biosynthesis protein PqqD